MMQTAIADSDYCHAHARYFTSAHHSTIEPQEVRNAPSRGRGLDMIVEATLEPTGSSDDFVYSAKGIGHPSLSIDVNAGFCYDIDAIKYSPGMLAVSFDLLLACLPFSWPKGNEDPISESNLRRAILEYNSLSVFRLKFMISTDADVDELLTAYRRYGYISKVEVFIDDLDGFENVNGVEEDVDEEQAELEPGYTRHYPIVDFGEHAVQRYFPAAI